MEITLIVFLAAAIALVLFSRKSKLRPKHTDYAKHTDLASIRHKKRLFLTTSNERKFFFALKKVCGDNYLIHCQTSLIALVEPEEFEHRARAWSKRVDFVITDGKSKVLAVIELDDSSHNSKKRQQRDRYVEAALGPHHKLLRFNTQQFYHPEHLAERLSKEADIDLNFQPAHNKPLQQTT